MDNSHSTRCACASAARCDFRSFNSLVEFACRALSIRLLLLVACIASMPELTAQTVRPGLPEKPPELIGTSQSSFEIPFSTGHASGSVVQAVLHVSTDRGRTWKEHSTRPPTASGFPFTAPAEGEYWFAIQTVNRDGQRSPSGEHLKSELRIVVDKVRPQLEFDVRPDAAGRLVASIKAEDAYIDPRSLVIEYQPNGTGDAWSSVPTASRREPAGGVFFDELAFWPEASGNALTIRATIRDLAGNPATATRHVNFSPAGGLPATVPPTASSGGAHAPATADSRIYTHYQQTRLPVALEHLYGNLPAGEPSAPRQAARSGEPAVPPPLSEKSSSSGEKPRDDIPLTARGSQPPQPPGAPNRLAENILPGDAAVPATLPVSRADSQWRSRTSGSTESQKVSEGSTHGWQPPGQVTQESPRVHVALQTTPAADHPQTDPPQHFVSPHGNGPPRLLQRLPAPDQPVAASPPADARNAVWSSSTTGAKESAPRPASLLASGPQFETLREMARHSNSRQFQLDYEIDAIGPEGIRAVELWMTTDGGNSWRRTTNDEDQRSPVNVQVETEGIVGFRVRVVSNEGLSAREPRRGDPADMWVNVDTTLPEAAITGAPYGTASDAGKLVIQWRASDANLALRPIRLRYSPQPDGPWTTIEDGLRNEGEFVWKPAVDTPDLVYLRLEVRDEAGNIRVDQPTHPVDISGLIPRGHIRGLTPIT